MRRATALAMLLLVLPAAAAAKEGPRAVRICGAETCRTIAADILGDAGPIVRTPRPGPYLTASYVWRDGSLDETTRIYLVPGAGVLRTGAIPEWRASGPRLRAALGGLRPFARPRIVRVEVDRRPASDPSSYDRLYMIAGRSADDPAGREPRLYWELEAWTRYYERVRRHWIPVNVWSARPSPWGDGDNYVWVSRRGRLLKRDGEVPADPRLARSLYPRYRLAPRLRLARPARRSGKGAKPANGSVQLHLHVPGHVEP